MTVKPDCDFCAIVHGGDITTIVFENMDCVAFFPHDPAVSGHTLVVPKKHSDDFLALDSATAAALSATVLQVAQAIKQTLQPDGMNIVTSAGEAASQTVFHTHVHIVPRWTDDAVGTFWPEMPPTIFTDVLQRAHARIREVLQ